MGATASSTPVKPFAATGAAAKYSADAGKDATRSAKQPRRRPRHYELTPQLRTMVDRWKLTPAEVDQLWAKFCEIDGDQSGTIEMDEFFSFINEPRSTFLDTMFALIVRDNNRHLDFAAWIEAVFAFSLSTRPEMIEQVFWAFDTDRNGYMDLSELHRFLVAIHSDNPIFPREVVEALTQKNLANDGRIDFQEFVEAERKYPMLLWPIFRMQHRMRRRTMGLAFFDRIDNRAAETYFSALHYEHLVDKWRARLDCLKLYLCGWPCCPLPDPGEPTPQEEIRARRRAMRQLALGQLRRVEEPRGGAYTYRPLPAKPHHTAGDEQIEREIAQVHVKPLVPAELLKRPAALSIIDNSGQVVELGDADADAELEELVEMDGPSEYPDIFELRKRN